MQVLFMGKEPVLVEKLFVNGFQGMHCKSVAQAVAQLRQNFYAVVVTKLGVTEEENGVQLIRAVREIHGHKVFVCVFSTTATTYLKVNQDCFAAGANMVTSALDVLLRALVSIRDYKVGPYACPYCGMQLDEDRLWEHVPLYHCNQPSAQVASCPVCLKTPQSPFAVHLRNRHGPVGRGLIPAEEKAFIPTVFVVLVICQRSDGKFLLVHEVANWGWWLPGGRVDPGETFISAAVREAREEAGIDINVMGILRMEHAPHKDYTRVRIVFYARPINDQQVPKSLPDFESVGAMYVTRDEVANVPLRGPEPQEWFRYVASGGTIYPLSMLTHEGEKVIV